MFEDRSWQMRAWICSGFSWDDQSPFDSPSLLNDHPKGNEKLES